MSIELERFLEAQNATNYQGISIFEVALQELKNGEKEGHWMWFIFPQLLGLVESENSRFYGIKGIEEATAYLQHPDLGNRLVETCQALLLQPDKRIQHILGWPDYLKLQSSMTLFKAVPGAPAVFQNMLDVFYAGESDENTLRLLQWVG
jgi:uncharacterized protein (DUF1810 family)